MKWIAGLNLAADDPIIEIGGGASTLIDDLLQLGHGKPPFIDLSERAIQLTKERSGKPSGAVTWLCGDITKIELPSKYYCLWHDRAVFHVLIEPEAQQKYRDSILKALKIGGYFLIGAFNLDAPPKCSGLPVQCYTAKILCKTFAKKFALRRHQGKLLWRCMGGGPTRDINLILDESKLHFIMKDGVVFKKIGVSSSEPGNLLVPNLRKPTDRWPPKGLLLDGAVRHLADITQCLAFRFMFL